MRLNNEMKHIEMRCMVCPDIWSTMHSNWSFSQALSDLRLRTQTVPVKRCKAALRAEFRGRGAAGPGAAQSPGLGGSTARDPRHTTGNQRRRRQQATLLITLVTLIGAFQRSI